MAPYDDDYAGDSDQHEGYSGSEGQLEPSDYGQETDEDGEVHPSKKNKFGEREQEDVMDPFGKQEELQQSSEEEESVELIEKIPESWKQTMNLGDNFEDLESAKAETRITSPFMSKYEKAIVIGKRAQQISMNSPLYIDVSTEELKRKTALDLAELEFEQNRIPFIIRRFMPDRTFEDWTVSELKRFSN